MMRPTPRTVLAFAPSIPLALLIVSISQEWWFFSLYLPLTVLALIGADMMTALPRRRLHLELRRQSRIYLGRLCPVELEFRAEGYARSLKIEALLEHTGEADPPQPKTAVLSDGRAKLLLGLRPHRRGRISIDAVWVRWRGPLGLVEQRLRHPVGETVDVVPETKGIYDAALQFVSRDAVHGLKAQQAKGEGTEFENLCDYAQGMDNCLIDWKRSARHRKLLCKEFRQERNHQVVLAFDTGHLMLEPIDGVPRLDHSIRAGSLLAWVSLYYGDLVGGCGFDARFRSFLKPGRGMPRFSQFQRFAAGLDYRTEETNYTLGLAELNSRLQRRALVVLFTEFADPTSAELLLESLRWMLRRHVVIFLTLRDPMLTRLQAAAPDDFLAAARAVIADDFLRERAVVLERITRLGAHCLDVPVRAVSTSLINRYLLIKQRGLL